MENGRRKNNIVITEWRGEGKSKKERESSRSKRTENFIKKNLEEAKIKDCYNVN
jgi:hypothetical protein